MKDQMFVEFTKDEMMEIKKFVTNKREQEKKKMKIKTFDMIPFYEIALLSCGSMFGFYKSIDPNNDYYSYFRTGIKYGYDMSSYTFLLSLGLYITKELKDFINENAFVVRNEKKEQNEYKNKEEQKMYD